MKPGLTLTIDGKDFHLGYSRLAKYMDCPKSYYYSYIEGIRTEGKMNMRRGSAYHEVVEHLLNHKIKTGELIDNAIADKMAVKAGKKFDLSENEIYKLIDAVRFYHMEMYPKHQPLATEEPFEIVRGGVKLTGRMDLVETNGVITDHKFSNDIWAESRSRYGCQPMIYQWAGLDHVSPKFGVDYGGFDYNIIRLWPYPLIQVIHVPPIPQEQSDWWEEQLETFAKGIKHGIFPAIPKDKQCGWCDHKKLCKPCIYTIEVHGGAGESLEDLKNFDDCKE